MPFREFDDAVGARWVVWSTIPSNGVALSSGMEDGWLTFEGSGDRRRLAPIPEGWAELQDVRLELLLKMAVPAPRLDSRRGGNPTVASS
jgi:hypothetical protein